MDRSGSVARFARMCASQTQRSRSNTSPEENEGNKQKINGLIFQKNYTRGSHLETQAASGALLVTLHLAPAFVADAVLGLNANEVLAATVPAMTKVGNAWPFNDFGETHLVISSAKQYN